MVRVDLAQGLDVEAERVRRFDHPVVVRVEVDDRPVTAFHLVEQCDHRLSEIRQGHEHLTGHVGKRSSLGHLSTGADGRIWCAMVSPVNTAAERLATSPPLLRKLVWKLPDRLQPQIKPEVWAVAFDPDSGEVAGGLRTEHPSFGMVTGLVESGGRLWMGCIGSPAVAHCAIPQ